MELWTHQVEQTTSVQQSIHVIQDMFSMEISQEHVKRMQTGVEVNQLVMVSGTIYTLYIILLYYVKLYSIDRCDYYNYGIFSG